MGLREKKTRSIFVVGLIVIASTILTPTAVSVAEACTSEDDQTTNLTSGMSGSSAPDIVPTTVSVQPPEGWDWAVVEHSEWTTVGPDSRLVRHYFKHGVKPRGTIKGPAGSLPAVAAVTCTYLYDAYFASGNDGGTGVWNNLQNNFHLTRWNNDSYTGRAYVIYSTTEWWNRPDSNYDVSAASVAWDMVGWNCTNAYIGYHGSTNPAVTWQSSTLSYYLTQTYPTSYWPDLTQGPFNSGTEQSTLSNDIYWAGVYTASSSTKNTFPW